MRAVARHSTPANYEMENKLVFKNPFSVNRTQNTGQYVAFTFDDGPDPTITPQLMGVLAAHNVTATFCLIGSKVQAYPALVRQIAAAGHRLANHSWNHENMGTWPVADIRDNLTATNDAILAAVQDAQIDYFRAPFAAWGFSPQVAVAMGMTSLEWSVDPQDWSDPGVDLIVSRVREQLQPTGVVLLHERAQTVQAVDQLVPGLLGEGWQFDAPMLATGSAPRQ